MKWKVGMKFKLNGKLFKGSGSSFAKKKKNKNQVFTVYHVEGHYVTSGPKCKGVWNDEIVYVPSKLDKVLE